MKLLLDTHTLLWWLTDHPNLSGAARDLISSHGAFVSVASLWEVEIKRAIGKLEGDTTRMAEDVTATEGFTWLSVAPKHVLALVELPRHHNDPFDRMLVAQAKSERAMLLSRNPAMHVYDVEVMW